MAIPFIPNTQAKNFGVILESCFLPIPNICQEFLLSWPLEYIQNLTITLFWVDNIISCLYYYSDLANLYSL